MQRPEVTRLYKYYPPSEYSLAALREEAYWVSSPASFNDPFDCGISLAEDALEESVANAVQRIRQEPEKYGVIPDGPVEIRSSDVEAYDFYRQQLASLAASIGVLCLSETRDNLLMWAHYSQSHQGFCVGFARAADNTLGTAAYPVHYTKELPRLTARHFDSRVHPNSFDHLWLTKSSDWAYEREWRVVAERGGELRSLNAPVVELILGIRMEAAYRQQVLDILKGKGRSILVYQATRDKTRFGLVLEEIQA